MASQKLSVDTVRASRDGHEYHEIWTARKAMQLLWPDANLVAIAVEGPSPEDQARASSSTVDISDITEYYGRRPTFEHADRTRIIQFKYSIASADKEFRAYHAKKTVQKFGTTYRDYKKKYGAKAVRERLEFQLVTNQPIYSPLLQAIDSIAKGQPQVGDVAKQAKQFTTASGLGGKALKEFAEKCKIIGRLGSLPATKDALTSMLIDWTATNDPVAAAHLGRLKQLVRDKAGHAGQDQNLIVRTDILSAFQINDPSDLLPCEAALVDIGQIVRREQLDEAVALIPGLKKSLLVHASGGVGKTVFLDSLCKSIDNTHEVVFFDCFGGGSYRSPEDARHLPKRGLLHIANSLAFRGLCDPIIPGNPDPEALLKVFRRRLEQCVKTLTTMAPDRGLALFIDAIDNADIIAKQQSEQSFPVMLLDSFHQNPIAGVKLVVSCRTERKPETFAVYHNFELQPFTLSETTNYLRARLKDVSRAEINVAQSRSNGNPRILEYLLKGERGLLDESEIGKTIELNELIQDRINEALSEAMVRGYEQEDIDAFLAGLAVLPPPVPVDEYAGAHGIETSAIESFASDLSPLLERSNQGLMFRDEPTETFVHDNYSTSPELLRRVADNLNDRQDSSVYAARALPGLLHKLDDGEQLFKLAFDDRMPPQITSTVGKRNIRYARLKAAALHAAINNDYNRLVELMLELSTIAAVDQRGADYILEYPDLVIAAEDVDATRRLFETKTMWPGTRHAKLAIANCLSGDDQEAIRHAVAVDEWIYHYRSTKSEDQFNRARPDHTDIASIPFLLTCDGRGADASRYLRGWKEWYSFEVCQDVFRLVDFAFSRRSLPSRRRGGFIKALADIGSISAALSFNDLGRPKQKELCIALARRCKRETRIELRESYSRDRTYQLDDGLRKCAAIALTLGLLDEALAISLRAPHQRPGIWSFRDSFSSTNIFGRMFRVAIIAAAKKKPIHEKDLLPGELVPVCARIPKRITGKDFRDSAKKKLPAFVKGDDDEGNPKNDRKTLTYDSKQTAERFIDHRLEALLALTNALADFLAASPRNVNKKFLELLDSWESARKKRDHYRVEKFDNLFQSLGLQSALFALWTCTKLSPASIKRFLECLHEQDVNAATLTEIVAILARRRELQALAGEQAVKARDLIEDENDVTHRASLLAELGRAMLPASVDEASAYFHDGLEHMDAIGSGDYEFTNELLLFASTLKGDELDECDFHTLTNICELNLGEEPEKFYWVAFSNAMSRAAGSRGLAKLSRWDDRNRVGFDNSLLPYLTALLNDRKIEPETALCLNRLANPVELYQCGTKEFAQAIRDSVGPEKPDVMPEIIRQYEDDNPGTPSESTLEALALLADESLGNAETTKHLRAAQKCYKLVRDTHNDRMNSRQEPDARIRRRNEQTESRNRATLAQITSRTDPLDESSLANGVKEFKNLRQMYGKVRDEFFNALRGKVPYGKRSQYVRHICALENLGLYSKLSELKQCTDEWKRSSSALSSDLQEEAIPLVRRHVEELISDGRLSGYKLKEISELSGVPIVDLVIELIKSLSRPDSFVAGAVWLSFGSFVNERADKGSGQHALKRMLRSEAASLADKVTDGPWVVGLYPEDDMQKIASSLVWRVLGSPYAKDRWRAAHSIRAFAKFGCWEVIDSIVEKIDDKSVGPFHAAELPFYFLHAKLWLLIALARAAFDHPKQVARYKNALLPIVIEVKEWHALMRYFAAHCLLTCVDSGNLRLQAKIVKKLREMDVSSYPKVETKLGHRRDSYSSRPDSEPEPEHEFSLEYDFHKHEVDRLARVFGKHCWQAAEALAQFAGKIDPDVTSMHEDGGRPSPDRRMSHYMSNRYHTYGQYVGWHALFYTAVSFFNQFPIAEDSWCDDRWTEWLGNYILTHKNGYWLSDGTERKPLGTAVFLLDDDKQGLLITGDKDRLLQLAGIGSRIRKEVVVEGHWHTADGLKVDISSALVPPARAGALARKLTREDPMLVWLPSFYENEDVDEYLRDKKPQYAPWIVSPSGEAKLDKYDPNGVPCACWRPRLASEFLKLANLSCNDPFGRIWVNNRASPC